MITPTHSILTLDGTARLRSVLALHGEPVAPTGFQVVPYSPEHDSLPQAEEPDPVPTPLAALAASGVEVAEGVVLGATEADVNQWARLQVQLDAKHEQASIAANLTWEQVRPAFNATPITVLRKDGTPWITTIGSLRSAITLVGDLYMMAWSQERMT